MSEHELQAGEFHSHDGWYWLRMPDGSVQIRTPSHVHTLTASSWASVMAHLSAKGESGETFAQAEKFHAGE